MFQGKNFFIALTLLGIVALAPSARAEPLADSVATLRLPGRGEFGQCRQFAEALSRWLGAHGQSSQIVYYAYKAGLAQRSAAHAIVTWQRDGQLWAMGNEAGHPRTLGGAADQQSMNVAQQYDYRAFAATRQDGRSPVLELLPVAAVAGLDLPPPIAKAPPVQRVLPPVAAAPRAPRTMHAGRAVAAPPRFYTDANGTQYLIPR